MCLDTKSSWTFLPQHFYNCNNLNLFFSGNHPLISKKLIPTFYSEIHTIYMKNFKNEPTNIIHTLNQSLWYNKYIKSNFDTGFIKNWSEKGINQIKDIVNEQCDLMTHAQLEKKYNLKTSFIHTLQLHTSIPKTWKQIIKQCTNKPKNIPDGNIIYPNNKETTIQKTTCTNFYWHLIQNIQHVPNNIGKWCEQFQNFHNADKEIWHRIFKLPFQVIRNTKIQTFQYRVLHRIIPCKKWLHTLKIKDTNICDYCTESDDISHFFIKCPKVKQFWHLLLNWLENVCNLQLQNIPILEECILFGYPYCSPDTHEKTDVINFCIIYAKYYIYIQRLFNNNYLEVYACQVQIKAAIETEFQICKKNNTLNKFEKFKFLHENL